MKERLLIVDRDGVINRDSPNYIKHPQEWEALPGSLQAIAQLRRANYRVVIITNQAGIAKGLYSINTLNQIHQKMRQQLRLAGGEINAIFFCPHAESDNCECRKPKPGLFLELADRLQCDLSETYAVGDSLRDLQAATSAGAKPVLVQSGNGIATAKTLRNMPVAKHDKLAAQLKKVPIYADLAAFVTALLTSETKTQR